MKKIFGIIVSVIVVVLIVFFVRGQKIWDTKQSVNDTIPTVSSQNTRMNKPSMLIDPSKQYAAVLGTSVGDIHIQLHAKETPVTVNNFVYLARNHFYDNTIFHRVISGFMIQGGDPFGTGTGGPGYQFDDEPFKGDYHRGVVAMANAGPNTNGSQFFIMQKDTDLPKNYVIFGEVTSGMEIVDAIAQAPVANTNGENSTPVTPVHIQRIDISEQ